MKLIKRDPLRFDVFNALMQFSKAENISLKDPKTTESFINRIRSSVDAAMANEAFVYGQRTQAMFEALIVSLGKVKVLKQEDFGEIYSTDEKIKVPDERLFFLDGSQMLIEVKNFFQKGEPFEAMELEEEYVDGLDRYARLMSCEWRLATYWVRWNQWTLVSPSTFKHEMGKATLSYRDAMVFNEMAVLGDMMIGTKFPLALTIVTNKEKPRSLDKDGMASFYLADMKIFCASQMLTSELERNIAWYLILHGNWEEQKPEPRISAGQVDEIRFEWLPETYYAEPDKYEKQGFAVIGSLSSMFSKYYRQVTLKDSQIGQLRVDVSPGSLGQMIPDDYKGNALPLWRFTLKPQKDSHMSTTSTRLFLGFLAGFLSHLIFQGGFGGILYAAHLVPALPWSLMPVPPLGVPRSLNLGFWAGLWGLAYALLEPRLTALFGRWSGGLVFGLAPLVVYWFVVLPLKGFGIGGGFHLAMVPIEIGFHFVFGIGTAIIFRSGLVLARRRVRASPER